MKKKYSEELTLWKLTTVILGIAIVILFEYFQYNQSKKETVTMTKYSPFTTNVIQQTQENTFFRQVLFTGKKSQLVVMSVPPGGEVGEETHEHTEQSLFFQSGTGKAMLDGKESPIVAGDVVVVPPGIKHNFINTGTTALKIYTVYAPPNHIDGRTHMTKADADKDVQDEAFGESVQ